MRSPERLLSAAPAPIRAAFLPAPDHRHAADLRGFVERHSDRLQDARVAYEVSQALEECYAVSRALPEASAAGLELVSAPAASWPVLAAGEALSAPCRGFEGVLIEPGTVLGHLERAARGGEIRAIARLLLMRDIADDKSEALSQLPALLVSTDPGVVRDVGAFLARGETYRRLGGEEVPAVVLAIAWELAACDLGYPCGPTARITLAQCAFAGSCGARDYEQALEQSEPPARLEHARRLRPGVVRALRVGDWEWLGIQ